MRKYFRAHFCLDFTDRDAKSGRSARAFSRYNLFLCAFLCIVFDEEIHASNLLQNATKAHGKKKQRGTGQKNREDLGNIAKTKHTFLGGWQDSARL